MRKTKQRPWIGNSGLRSLDYQQTIFTGLGSLDFPTKKFHRSWMAKSGHWFYYVQLSWVKLLAIYFTASGLPGKLIDGSISTIFPYKEQKEEREKRLQHKCFPVNFVQFLRTPFFNNNYGGCFWRWAWGNQANAMKSRLNKCYLWMIHFELFWQPVEMGT